MRASQTCIDLIKSFEGFRSEPYTCPAGKLTIGYGTTRGVTREMRATEAEAEALLRRDLVLVEEVLAAALKVRVSQQQFDALCCWAYNVGIGNATRSSLLRRLNGGERATVADEFLRWNRAGGEVLPGLIRRREAERALFLSGEAA